MNIEIAIPLPQSGQPSIEKMMENAKRLTQKVRQRIEEIKRERKEKRKKENTRQKPETVAKMVAAASIFTLTACGGGSCEGGSCPSVGATIYPTPEAQATSIPTSPPPTQYREFLSGMPPTANDAYGNGCIVSSINDNNKMSCP